MDQPDYVHVTNLKRFLIENQEMPSREAIIIGEDDESDDGSVVFFKIAYKQTDEVPRRRNPARKIKSIRRYLRNEHILEEDFHVLDLIEQENYSIVSTSNKPDTQSKSITENKLYKNWPENAHEIPFYPATVEIMPIQVPKYVKVPIMPKRLLAKRKPKPKFFVRQRRPKSTKEKTEKKFSVEELEELISEALEKAKDYIKKSGNKELEWLLKEQESLKALVTTTVKSCL